MGDTGSIAIVLVLETGGIGIEIVRVKQEYSGRAVLDGRWRGGFGRKGGDAFRRRAGEAGG